MRIADETPRLDPTDLAIIEAVQKDGRISHSELGRRIGLSQPATSERMKRLEERGVISGYTAVLDFAALGLGTMAIIRLRTAHEHIRACLKQFSAMPEVIETLRLTGEDCFLLKVIVPSPGESRKHCRLDWALRLCHNVHRVAERAAKDRQPRSDDEVVDPPVFGRCYFTERPRMALRIKVDGAAAQLAR